MGKRVAKRTVLSYAKERAPALDPPKLAFKEMKKRAILSGLKVLKAPAVSWHEQNLDMIDPSFHDIFSLPKHVPQGGLKSKNAYPRLSEFWWLLSLQFPLSSGGQPMSWRIWNCLRASALSREVNSRRENIGVNMQGKSQKVSNHMGHVVVNRFQGTSRFQNAKEKYHYKCPQNFATGGKIRCSRDGLWPQSCYNGFAIEHWFHQCPISRNMSEAWVWMFSSTSLLFFHLCDAWLGKHGAHLTKGAQILHPPKRFKKSPKKNVSGCPFLEMWKSICFQNTKYVTAITCYNGELAYWKASERSEIQNCDKLW